MLSSSLVALLPLIRPLLLALASLVSQVKLRHSRWREELRWRQLVIRWRKRLADRQRLEAVRYRNLLTSLMTALVTLCMTLVLIQLRAALCTNR